MPQKKIAIIGGGVAGISAAVCAIDAGWKPLLIERTSQLGGRVKSVFAKDAGYSIDNGQHVLSASYRETISLLTTLNTINKIHFQDRLTIQYFLSAQRRFLFKTWPLPAPFHFLLPLWFLAPITRRDKRFIRRWARIYRKLTPRQLKSMTVREWLEEAGDSDTLEKMLWEPITLATLNTSLEHASAYLLKQVLDNAFLGTAKNSGLGIPDALLGDIFGTPAEKYISEKGGEILYNTAITKLHHTGNRFQAIETKNGEKHSADVYVSAVPPNGLDRLVSSNSDIATQLKGDFNEFQYSPIITINLWVKEGIETEFPAAFIDSPIQWMFPFPAASWPDEGFAYTVVLSAADREAGLTNEALLALVDREIGYFFGKSLRSGYGLQAWKIVREKTATFLQTPESLRLRPETRTDFSNFYLAGDWINTDLPATIEGAVLSGRMAVDAALADE